MFPVYVELDSTVSRSIELLVVSVLKSGTELSTELSSLIDSDTVLLVKSSLKNKPEASTSCRSTSFKI